MLWIDGTIVILTQNKNPKPANLRKMSDLIPSVYPMFFNCAKLSSINIFKACEQGDLESVKIYVSLGKNVNVANSKGFTPLHIASFHFHHEIVHFLLKNGANVNAISKCGKTALHSACQNVLSPKMLEDKNICYYGVHSSPFNKIETIEWLLISGVYVNKHDNNGVTALHMLCACNDFCDLRKAFHLFVKYGADLNTRDNRGATPLHYLCKNENIFTCWEYFEMLFDNGANINAVDDYGLTALHYAATNSDFEHLFSDILNKLKSLRDVVDLNGNTFLHVACMYHSHDTICKTIDISQVNFHTRNKKGSTAFFFLYKNGDSSSYEVYNQIRKQLESSQ